MIERIAAVSDYLLTLYARSAEADAADYSSFALDGLCELLGADKAWWGTISDRETGPRLLSSFRSGLPPTWEIAWEAVKQDDKIATTIAQTKNRAVELDSQTIGRGSGLLQLAHDFDLGHTLSISVDLPDPASFMFVSLYRRYGQLSFTPDDKSIKQSVIPHIQAAWQRNLRERLRPLSGEYGDAEIVRAFVDRDGKLVQHDERFPAIIARHWPAWHGSILPLLLRESIDCAHTKPGTWIGRGRWRIRAASAGLLTLVELREICAIELLTPRERQTAQMFAEGATHKDIARLTGLAPTTVRHYLRETYAKLGIDNKAALANLFSRRGQPGERN